MCTTKKAPTCTLFWYTLVLLNFNLCGTQAPDPSVPRTLSACMICAILHILRYKEVQH